MCCSKRSTASRISRVMQSGHISTVLPFGWSCHQVSRETGGDCTAHSGIATLQPSASALPRTSDFLVATPPKHLPHLQHLITYKSLRLVTSVVYVASDTVLVWIRPARRFLAFSRGTRAPRCLRLLAAGFAVRRDVNVMHEPSQHRVLRQGLDEALATGVVIRVRRTAHARNDPMLFQNPHVFFARVLQSAVGGRFWRCHCCCFCQC